LEAGDGDQGGEDDVLMLDPYDMEDWALWLTKERRVVKMRKTVESYIECLQEIFINVSPFGAARAYVSRDDKNLGGCEQEVLGH
jgi:hypothetical protein